MVSCIMLHNIGKRYYWEICWIGDIGFAIPPHKHIASSLCFVPGHCVGKDFDIIPNYIHVHREARRDLARALPDSGSFETCPNLVPVEIGMLNLSFASWFPLNLIFRLINKFEDAVWYPLYAWCVIVALSCLPSAENGPSKYYIRLLSFELVFRPCPALTHSLTAGSILLYSLYAPIIQTHLGFTQLGINAIFIAGELGMYFTVPYSP